MCDPVYRPCRIVITIVLGLAGLGDCKCGTGLVHAQPADEQVPLEGEHDPPRDYPTEEFASLFRDLEYRVDSASSGVEVHRAFLYEPTRALKGCKYPLVVWLHGAGAYENGRARGPLKWLPRLHEEGALDPEHNPFFLLVPTCSAPDKSWIGTPACAGGADMLSVMEAFVDEVVRDFSIDDQRISLVGVSSGGAACWEWALRHPERFAAIAPLASSGGKVAGIGRLKSVPVWSFVNRGDKVAPSARVSIDALHRLGGSAYLTEYPKEGHNAWSQALHESNVIQWLISKSKTDAAGHNPPGPPTGKRVWTAVKISIVDNCFAIMTKCGLLAIMVGFYYLARREFERSKLEVQARPIVLTVSQAGEDAACTSDAFRDERGLNHGKEIACSNDAAGSL